MADTMTSRFEGVVEDGGLRHAIFCCLCPETDERNLRAVWPKHKVSVRLRPEWIDETGMPTLGNPALRARIASNWSKHRNSNHHRKWRNPQQSFLSHMSSQAGASQFFTSPSIMQAPAHDHNQMMQLQSMQALSQLGLSWQSAALMQMQQAYQPQTTQQTPWQMLCFTTDQTPSPLSIQTQPFLGQLCQSNANPHQASIPWNQISSSPIDAASWLMRNLPQQTMTRTMPESHTTGASPSLALAKQVWLYLDCILSSWH